MYSCADSAGQAAANGDSHVHAALQEVLKTVRPSVQRGLKPGSEAGWTVQQYATAVRAITAGAPYAVRASVLIAQLGGGYAGSQVLQAMVRADLVAIRPYSFWARDVPKGAFRASDGPDFMLEEVVTAPTPADLYCMRELALPDPTPSAGPVGQETGMCNAIVPCRLNPCRWSCKHTCCGSCC